MHIQGFTCTCQRPSSRARPGLPPKCPLLDAHGMPQGDCCDGIRADHAHSRPLPSKVSLIKMYVDKYVDSHPVPRSRSGCGVPPPHFKHTFPTLVPFLASAGPHLFRSLFYSHCSCSYSCSVPLFYPTSSSSCSPPHPANTIIIYSLLHHIEPSPFHRLLHLPTSINLPILGYLAISAHPSLLPSSCRHPSQPDSPAIRQLITQLIPSSSRRRDQPSSLPRNSVANHNKHLSWPLPKSMAISRALSLPPSSRYTPPSYRARRKWTSQC